MQLSGTQNLDKNQRTLSRSLDAIMFVSVIFLSTVLCRKSLQGYEPKRFDQLLPA